MQGSGSSRTPALEVRDLSRIYGTGDIAVRALRGVSFHVASGDMVCIMGKSGSGKSTLLRQLGLLDAPSSGQVLLDGVDVTRLRESHRRVLRLEHLGYVFQEYALLPELTAEENVYLPSLMSGTPLRQARLQARELLAMLDLENRAGHRPSDLSGGQQQRVAIARALINNPKIILADEPTGNLDRDTGTHVMELLQRINRERGVTVLMVTHDEKAAAYAQRVIRIEKGQVA